MNSGLVSLMIAFPFFGAISQVAQIKGGTRALGKWLSLGSSICSALLGIFLVVSMGRVPQGEALSESVPWVGSYAISYSVGIDGLNLILVLLISIVFPILIVSEWTREKGGSGVRGLLLLLQTAILGIVCSRDIFLLFFFWAFSVLPFYFLLSMWGEKNREIAAFRYLVTSSFGNALVFLSFVLVYYSVSPNTFLIADLLGGRVEASVFSLFGFSVGVGALAFLLLGLGICFRIPIWPLHGWFSYVITQAPASVAVALCGVFVPSALYVFVRLSYSLFPVAVLNYSDIVVCLGTVNVVFGAISAISQGELRKFMAYLCLAQVGILLIGFSSLESAGVVGAVYHLFSFGLGLAGFGLFVGLINERFKKTTFIGPEGNKVVSGLVSEAPIMTLVVALVFVSILGIPGVGGYVGQSLIFMGGFAVYPVAVFIVSIGVLFLIYGVFSLFRNIFLGGEEGEGGRSFDLTIRERGYLVPLVSIIVLVGVYPKPLLDLIRPSVLTLLSLVR